MRGPRDGEIGPDRPVDPDGDLELRIAEVGKAIRGRRSPTRYDARDLLILLGRRALDAEQGESDSAVIAVAERLRVAVEPWGEAWERAVEEELALAAGEHVRSVDPRFLAHPRYDLAYTVGARERLEARLVACRLLGLDPPEALLDRIEEADVALEPLLRGSEEPDAPPTKGA